MPWSQADAENACERSFGEGKRIWRRKERRKLERTLCVLSWSVSFYHFLCLWIGFWKLKVSMICCLFPDNTKTKFKHQSYIKSIIALQWSGHRQRLYNFLFYITLKCVTITSSFHRKFLMFTLDWISRGWAKKALDVRRVSCDNRGGGRIS